VCFLVDTRGVHHFADGARRQVEPFLAQVQKRLNGRALLFPTPTDLIATPHALRLWGIVANVFLFNFYARGERQKVRLLPSFPPFLIYKCTNSCRFTFKQFVNVRFLFVVSIHPPIGPSLFQ
jgi:hypothetical protein